MTRFTDGPAIGKVLMLHVSPKYLRVTECNGTIDALDNQIDSPRQDEKLFAYVLVKNEGMVHINRGRKGGGFYPMAEYRLVGEQPADAVMRSNADWQKWCDSAGDVSTT